VSCDHCGLPVPRGLVRAHEERQFCCGACEIAWETIHACGMDRFYELAQQLSGERERAEGGTGKAYEELEASAAIDTTDARRYTTQLTIRGLHCAACVWLLERLPKIDPGVLEARVSLPRARVTLAWDPERTSLPAIARRIDALGYRVQPWFTGAGGAERSSTQKRYLVRIGVAGAIAGNIMLAAVALYAGEHVGIEPVYE